MGFCCKPPQLGSPSAAKVNTISQSFTSLLRSNGECIKHNTEGETSKSCGPCGRAGSSPAPGTKAKLRHQFRFFFITMYTVYAISSISHKYIYVGLTSDLNARVRRDNFG